ncbi:ATP-binding cassette transporter [Dorcoceras hygrometricum]|uniref:ATP-binding cassette transporter n=1 Tax=Dorcoceras hygrometricum TaxID=472368 RepID=A0A2Z7D4Q5_9LAMI|nr:ATP-binding cassette transporter [Dorcoceras hygrometricum]
MGSNPSTESNNTTEITARNKMQVLCMRRQGTMESSTQKGANELKHSSKNHRQRTVATGCVHINHSAHGGYDPSREMRVRYSRSTSHPAGTQTRSTSWYQTQHPNDVASTNLNAVVLTLNATTLKHLLITQTQPDFTQTTAFQESRAKTRFDWFCHRPVASSPNQLTRHPAGLTIERIYEQLTAEPAVEVSQISSDSPADQVDEELPWFVRSFLRADRDNERLFEPGSDSENAMDIEDNSQDLPVVRDTCVSTVGEQEVTAFGEQFLGTNDESSEDIKAVEPVEKSADEFFDDDEARSLEDILLSIPVDVPLSSAGMEITKIVMGNEIKIPEVTERTWFLNSLPKIPADHKGKAILVEKDPIKGNPAQEHYFLINADIDLLVELRAKYSLFSRLPTEDITDFLSSIALERTVLRSVQNSIGSADVPHVQFSLEQRQSYSSSTDSSSCLNFDATDLDAPVSSLPTVSIDFSAALADFQAILLAQIDESQSGISSRLHKIEQILCDSLRDQADIFKNLSQGARQEARTIDDVQTLRFNEFRKNVLAQNAFIFTGLADVRKEVQEVNAKVDILASRLNDIQNNVEETKEALCHQLLEFQSQSQANQNILNSQLSELMNYINRGGADKKGESSSRGPQQPDAQISASA